MFADEDAGAHDHDERHGGDFGKTRTFGNELVTPPQGEGRGQGEREEAHAHEGP